MNNLKSQKKYLEVLKTLNSIRKATYHRMTTYVDKNFQKLFSKFSLDSAFNLSELSHLLVEDGDGMSTKHYSFEPSTLSKSLNKGGEDLFDLFRDAEWRLIKFYEQLIGYPRLTKEVRTVLISQRDKVLRGFEHLNFLSRNPW